MSYKQELLTALEHYQELINGMYSIRELLNKIESIYQQDTTTLPPRSLNHLPIEELIDSETTTEEVFRLMCRINQKCKENITYFINYLPTNELKQFDFKLREFLEKKASNDDLNDLIKFVSDSDVCDDEELKELINTKIQEYTNKVS